MIYYAIWKQNEGSSHGASDDREFDASLSIWMSMAYFVGAELNIDPYFIYRNWSCSHLLVVWGYFANNKAREAYELWRNDTSENRGKRPKQYAAMFITPDHIESAQNEEQNEEESEAFKLLKSFYEN